MNIQAIKTKVFIEHENLQQFLVDNISELHEGSVVAITSKIVALAEGRTESLSRDREEVIRDECDFMMRTPYTWLTIKDGTVMSSAGIDESNAEGKYILLPKDSFETAHTIRDFLRQHYNLENLGVVITDSRLLPLRAGVVGVALGYAGFKGVRDYRGTKDLSGREMKLSRTDIADSLATAAVMEMGEGAESQPLALITRASVEFVDAINRDELYIDPAEDVYAPLFTKLSEDTQ